MRLEVALDAHAEGHSAGGAADAGAVKPNLNHAVGGDRYELDIPPVGLNGGADEREHLLDALTKARGWCTGWHWRIVEAIWGVGESLERHRYTAT